MKLNSLSKFVIGFSAGAAVMMLFTPKSGRDMRRSLGRRVDEGREFIERGAAKVQDIGEGMRNTSKKIMKYANKSLAV